MTDTDQTDQTTEQELSTAVDSSQDAPETFPREYVERLRQEAAEARIKAKRAEDYARELFAARVAALGRLADPSDLDFDENLLDDHAALEHAVDELISRKPHLAARTPRGDIGQGATHHADTVDLSAILRQNA